MIEKMLHTERWDIELQREGDDDWENRVEYGWNRPLVMRPDLIEVRIERGQKLSVMLHGALVKKNGEPGKNRGNLIFAEDLGWVMVIVNRYRHKANLTPERTGVAW
jgi:hypothetical protein